MKTIGSAATGSPGLLQARYPHFHGLPDMAGIVDVDNVALDLRNCSVDAGKMRCDATLDTEKVDVINNLFERADVAFNAPNVDRFVDFYNNTAINSTLTFTANGNSFTCFVKDNLFDHCTVTAVPAAGEEGGISSGNNRHHGDTPEGLSSTPLSAGVQYATGPFGDRYIDPSYSELSSLVNAGSRSAAAAGLSAYTILSDDSQDIGIVDIGHHYPVAIENLSGGAFWTDSVASADQMARAIMAGTGATVVPGSAKYTGADVASGFFGGGSSVGLEEGYEFPIDQGVILSSGDIALAHGPNDNSFAAREHTFPLDDDDDDLDDLLGAEVTHDAAVLEFRINSGSATSLTFNYIFASEEYPEFVGTDYNDVMGIFVDLQVTGQRNNIAWLPLEPPNPDTPVTVNKVNGGCEKDFYGVEQDPVNLDYYVDNDDPIYDSMDPHDADDPVYQVQYDGFATHSDHTALVAQTTVAPNTEYTIKIAIADAEDENLDSAAFIEATLHCP